MKNRTHKKKHSHKREKTFFSRIKNKILKSSIEKRILHLQELSWKKIVCRLLFNFFIGTVILLHTNTIHYFFPHLLCLTFNIVITLAIGKEYADTILSLDNDILKKHKKEYIELRSNYKRFRKYAFNSLNLILCIVILVLFFWGIFSQHYIELDIVGCYAVCIVSITVSISVIGYTQYLWMLWFLYRICNCSSVPHYKSIPAYTPFLVKIGTLTQHTKWCFFLEGFLYVFEYLILIPDGNITLSNINMPDNVSFLVTWGVIFVVIILAFPTLIFVQELLMSQIVSNLKTQEIETLSLQVETLSQNRTQHFPEVYMCNRLIDNLLSGPDYPVKIQRLGPAIVSVATVVLHIANLLNQYPELKTFLINRFLGNSV